MTPPEQIEVLVSLDILSTAVMRLREFENDIRIYGPDRDAWLNAFDAAIIQAQRAQDIVKEHHIWMK